METLQISKANALKAYNEADGQTKKMLASLFGEATLSQKITDRVKTFENACEVLGLDTGEYQKMFKQLIAVDESDAMEALVKLCIIAKALNEGWQADFGNVSQYKYYPWFKSVAGSGLSCHGYGTDYSITYVGSRLCFKTSELAKYAGQQFIDLYKVLFNLK